MQTFNSQMEFATRTISSGNYVRKQRSYQELQEIELKKTIEENHKGFLQSQLELTEVVKKDGKMILEPKLKEPDMFQTRVKSNKAFNFCINIEKLARGSVTVKMELRSFDEISMLIKQNSLNTVPQEDLATEIS